MRERLAALEHEHWVTWSKEVEGWLSYFLAILIGKANIQYNISDLPDIIRDRIALLQEYSIPYADLPEDARGQSRQCADEILAIVNRDAPWAQND